MPHPVMFEQTDARLRRIRQVTLALPGAQEKVSHGRPAFFTTKVFAYYGGSEKVEGRWVEHAQCVLLLLDSDERAALVQDERVFVPGYLGAYGWIGFDLPALRGDWTEVAELVESSYRNTAGPGLVAQLDGS